MNFLNGVIYVPFFGTVHYHFRDIEMITESWTVQSQVRLNGCAGWPASIGLLVAKALFVLAGQGLDKKCYIKYLSMKYKNYKYNLNETAQG